MKLKSFLKKLKPQADQKNRKKQEGKEAEEIKKRLRNLGYW